MGIDPSTSSSNLLQRRRTKVVAEMIVGGKHRVPRCERG
jgi:hypothetical protein